MHPVMFFWFFGSLNCPSIVGHYSLWAQFALWWLRITRAESDLLLDAGILMIERVAESGRIQKIAETLLLLFATATQQARTKKLCVPQGNCRNLQLKLPCLVSQRRSSIWDNQFLTFAKKALYFLTQLLSLLLIVLCTRQSRKWGNFPWFHFEILPARIESPNKFSVCSKNFTHSLTLIQSKLETVCTTIEQHATPLWEEEKIIISSTVELLTLL